MIVYACKLNRYPKRGFEVFSNGANIGQINTETIAETNECKELAKALENQDWNINSCFFCNQTFMWYHKDIDVLQTFMSGWSAADSWYRMFRLLVERSNAIN